MAERVIYVLESIEVDRDHCEAIRFFVGGRELSFEQIEKGGAIPQTGQCITLGKRLDPSEGFVAGHYVVEHGSADEDRTDVEDADEDCQYDMHDSARMIRARAKGTQVKLICPIVISGRLALRDGGRRCSPWRNN